MLNYVPTAIFWLVALAYANGAAVHVANMLGRSGYPWREAPLKWQVLDVFYLVLDVIVVVGLVLGWRIGLIAFFVAVATQLLLYTAFRSWILDVPERFVTPGMASSLNGLLVFHIVTVALIVFAIWLRSHLAVSGP